MDKWRKMFPWRVRLLVGGVAVTAGVVTVQNYLNLGPMDAHQLAAVLVFGTLAAASHFRPSWSFNQQAVYSTVAAAYFAVAMVVPRTWIPPAIILSWLPWVTLRYRQKPTWPVEVTFNLSVDIVVAVVARDMYHLVEGLVPSPTLALVAGAVAYTGLQTLLVTAAVVLYRRVPLGQVDTLKLGFLSAELVTVFVGGITALLYRMDPMSLVVIFLPLGYLQRLMEKVQNQKAAYVDAKTGLFNYKYVDERLPKEVERAKITGMPLSLVFADLDFLREINNHYGHLAGDAAIRHAGTLLRSCAQDAHFVARFGGEEYMLVLPQVDHREALRIAELARCRVAETPVECGEAHFRVTMSFGVATVPEDAVTVRDLVHAADMAVYQAKAAGRNCVRSYREGVNEPCVASR